jgi:hypothetical protein
VYSTAVFFYTQRNTVVLLSGFSPRRYMPVYAKTLTLHKGVNNQIQFQFLNQEQKPVDITGKSITCRILNYEGNQILLQKDLTIQFGATGISALMLNPGELIDIEAQKCYYTLEIPVNDFDYPVFVDQNAGARGVMNIVNSVLPNFLPSYSLTIPTGQQFPNTNPNGSGEANLTYYSSVLNTSDNPVLTIQTEYIEFYGNTTIQCSTIVDNDWYDIVTTEEVANSTVTVGYVIQGFHPYIRMQFTSNAGAVTNILTR